MAAGNAKVAKAKVADATVDHRNEGSGPVVPEDKKQGDVKYDVQGTTVTHHLDKDPNDPRLHGQPRELPSLDDDLTQGPAPRKETAEESLI